MKKVLLFTFMIFSFFSFGQKIKFKKDIAFVDGKEYLKSVEDPSSRNSYIISSLDGKELLYLKLNSYNDPTHIDKDNPTGEVIYFEVMSSDLNTVFFEGNVGGCLFCNLTYEIVKILYGSNAVKNDGTLDMEKLELLSKKIGFEFSRKRDELSKSSPGNTVIIQQDSRPRNGINISIGR